ncbi:unnamed protein product [Ceratitis capitata]|uniref:(Mediterranean fruit fly) hypothetical protein n=1 Tax=Ceratitis capitata TaxID=7213 RepID=A0A811V7J5_CERCA|nr:unnamed protein product [Ceratitis capitata]
MQQCGKYKKVAFSSITETVTNSSISSGGASAEVQQSKVKCRSAAAADSECHCHCQCHQQNANERKPQEKAFDNCFYCDAISSNADAKANVDGGQGRYQKGNISASRMPTTAGIWVNVGIKAFGQQRSVMRSDMSKHDETGSDDNDDDDSELLPERRTTQEQPGSLGCFWSKLSELILFSC